jgi:capsular polysaccharide transport system permease protein
LPESAPVTNAPTQKPLAQDSAPPPQSSAAAITISKQPKPDGPTPQDINAVAEPLAPAPPQHDAGYPASAVQSASGEAGPKLPISIESIRAEGLTARQLRMAMRVAQKHGIRPTSTFEAVLMLRQRGIDPFARSTLLDLVKDDPSSTGREVTIPAQTLPKVSAPAGLSAAANPVAESQDRMAQIAADRENELKRVQREIAKRRRKRLAVLGVRLLVFVSLPTFLVSWYFYMIATPMYATESQFIIQQADGQSGMNGLSGMLPSASGMGLGGQSEAASVQSFLQSRAAMLRLDQEEGFREHFSLDSLDFIRRLPADASDEAMFKTYKRHVKIGYDPTEGVVRMEVIAASPQDSQRFAQALIRFAEEHIDMMTQRLRDSQMREARENLEEAQQKLIEARLASVALQEQSRIMSSEVELSLLSQQIGALEAELTQTRLSLQELRSNTRPSPARLQPMERREEALRRQIEELRGSMTIGTPDGASLAQTQSQLIMAEAEIQTREMMRAQAMQQMEAARIEVNRQVRYLALSVEPVASDEAAYPRKLEYSSLAFLIFLGVYLFVSMTGSVLREQIAG